MGKARENTEKRDSHCFRSVPVQQKITLTGDRFETIPFERNIGSVLAAERVSFGPPRS